MYFKRLASILAPLLLASLTARGQFSWQLIKHEGRDYIPLQNVAQFYQMQSDVRGAGNHLSLQAASSSLETDGDPRQVLINGVKQWLSFPMYTENGQVCVSRFDLAKTIDPALRPNMIAGLHAFKTVVLDAGHGGQDRGANSTTGFEKDYTLDVIEDIKKLLLAKGFKVRLTRDNDVFVPLEERASQANEENDAIFVSVHFNSSPGGSSANGFEVFATTPRGASSTGDTSASLEQFRELPGNDVDNASLALATCVQHSLLGHIPQPDRGIKRARFVVLKLCKLPSVLVEGGFLTNPTESQRINEAGYREKLAEAIVLGVQSFQAVAEKRAMPRLLADYRMEQLPLAGRMVDPNAVAPGTVPSTMLPTANNISAGSSPAPSPTPPIR